MCIFQKNSFGNSGEDVRLWPGNSGGLKDQKASQLAMGFDRSLA